MSVAQILQVCAVGFIVAVSAESSEENDSSESYSNRQDKRIIVPQFGGYNPNGSPNKASSYSHFAASHQPLRPVQGGYQVQGRPPPPRLAPGNPYSHPGTGYVVSQPIEPHHQYKPVATPAPRPVTVYPVFQPQGHGAGFNPFPHYYPQQKPKLHPQKPKPTSFLPSSAFDHFPPGFNSPAQSETFFNYDETQA